MPIEGEYEPSTAAWVRDQVQEYESSGGTRGTTLRETGLPVVIITNRGARSGKLRKTPVMRVEHDGRYAAVASQGGAPTHPFWYYNFRAHPQVELQDGPARGEFVAREVTGDERAEWWERAVAAFRRTPGTRSGPPARSRCSCWSPPAPPDHPAGRSRASAVPRTGPRYFILNLPEYLTLAGKWRRLLARDPEAAAAP